MKILNIFHELLMEDFKSQRKKFIEQGYEPGIVDTYLKDFDEIRKSKFKEARESEIQGLNVPKGDARFNVDSYKTFRELEILVDFVAGQRKVGSANFEDIKVDGEPIFRNEDVEIYYADTPRACIQYKGNFPYSWCVARNDSGNMFYNYRLREYEPAFYFVKLIKRTKKEFDIWNTNKDVFNGKFKDKYHFFVVQVTNYGKYIVTSAMNEGDFEMRWNEILDFAPELTELKEIFQPKPLTKEEREKIEKYKNGLSDEEFAKLPYKEKEFYLAVYVQIDKPITFEQFKILPEDLKNKYVGFGVGLSDEQFELIKNNKNLIKRYSEITKRKFDEYVKKFDSNITFTNSEQLFIQDKIDKIFYEKGGELNNVEFDGLLNYSFKKDELIDYYIKLKKDELNAEDIDVLLKNSSKKDELIDYYIKLKGDELSALDTVVLSHRSMKKNNELVDYYLNLKGDNLTSDDFITLLQDSSNQDELINYYINLKKGNVDPYTINIILFRSSNRREIFQKMIDLQNQSKINEQIIRIKKMFSII